jgi:hypothetical protein
LEMGEVRYFELTYPSDMDEISITRTILDSDISSTDDVEVYGSFQTLRPSASNNEFSLKGATQKVLKITHKELKRKCSGDCKIFLSTRSLGSPNTYTLMVRFRNGSIELLEGVSQVAEAPIKDVHEWVRFYYRVPKDRSVRVQTSSVYQDLVVFANFANYSGMKKYLDQAHSSKFESFFPTAENYEVRSDNISSFGNSVLTLNEADLEKKKCDKTTYGCLMLITVVLNNQSYFY